MSHEMAGDQIQGTQSTLKIIDPTKINRSESFFFALINTKIQLVSHFAILQVIRIYIKRIFRSNLKLQIRNSR